MTSPSIKLGAYLYTYDRALYPLKKRERKKMADLLVIVLELNILICLPRLEFKILELVILLILSNLFVLPGVHRNLILLLPLGIKL